MLLGHARVGVTQLRRDNAHWDAAPSQGAGVCVPQAMECRGRLKPGPGARLLKASLLMRGPPGVAVIAGEDEIASIDRPSRALPRSKTVALHQYRATWRGLPALLSRTVTVPA